jgi:hypothetical protein
MRRNRMFNKNHERSLEERVTLLQYQVDKMEMRHELSTDGVRDEQVRQSINEIFGLIKGIQEEAFKNRCENEKPTRTISNDDLDTLRLQSSVNDRLEREIKLLKTIYYERSTNNHDTLIELRKEIKAIRSKMWETNSNLYEHMDRNTREIVKLDDRLDKMEDGDILVLKDMVKKINIILNTKDNEEPAVKEGIKIEISSTDTVEDTIRKVKEAMEEEKIDKLYAINRDEVMRKVDTMCKRHNLAKEWKKLAEMMVKILTIYQSQDNHTWMNSTRHPVVVSAGLTNNVHEIETIIKELLKEDGE